MKTIPYGRQDITESDIEAVNDVLRSDPRFTSLSDQAALAEAALERAEDNLQEIDQDSARKLPAYAGRAIQRKLE